MGYLKTIPVVFLFLSCNGNSIKNHHVLVESGQINLFGDTLLNVEIPDIYVQEHEVTNAEFNEFVLATGYKTSAEIEGKGMVFNRTSKKWELTEGASWQHPQGKNSTIKNKWNHPVVQVSNKDACAYCAWKGMRLPYESEWEYIFSKDEDLKEFNYWQGIFPIEDKGEDGFIGTSPVMSFNAGKSTCYDLRGNVWEWCNDYYHETWPSQASMFPDSIQYKGAPASYSGNNMYDTLKVIKGGSFLCAENYCRGYQSNTRMHADPRLGYEHTGFRCVQIK